MTLYKECLIFFYFIVSAFPRYMSNATVGFVGLGNMGSHMARNLLKKGHPVVAYDAVPQNVLALKADGKLSDQNFFWLSR